MGSVSGREKHAKFREGCLFSSSSRGQTFSGKVGNKRITLFILVCPDYLRGLPSIPFPLRT